MTNNKPPVKRAFQVRPERESFLNRYGTESPLDRRFERITFLLGKKTLEGRNKPR
jgi:hypothetical protein